MRATLEFQLPDEQYEFARAVEAGRAFATLAEISYKTRAFLKHGEPSFEDAIEMLSELMALANETLDRTE